MTRSRKRKRGSPTNPISGDTVQKKRRTSQADSHTDDRQAPPLATIQHAVLSRFYPRVYSLRDYVLSRLPPTSKIRRKKVAAIGKPDGTQNPPLSDIERSVGNLLDHTLVGILEDATCIPADDRWGRWTTFSQKGDESYVTLSDGIADSKFSQSEVGQPLNPELHKRTCLGPPTTRANTDETDCGFCDLAAFLQGQDARHMAKAFTL